MTYNQGKDVNGLPLEEGRFYINVRSRKIMFLQGDGEGFLEVVDGCPVEIFRLEKGPEYRRATKDDINTAIRKCQTREAWLKSGIENITED
jgi:hypothetical protein